MVKKVAKTTNTNKLVDKPPKDVSKTPYKVSDYYYDAYSWKKIPISEAYLERVAEELSKWSDFEEALTLTQFFTYMKINSTDFYRWLERSTTLRLSYKNAMEKLVSRREVGAINKKYDGNFVKYSMPLYSKAWDELSERYAKRGANSDGDPNAPKIVIMEKFPETDVVPKRKVEE